MIFEILLWILSYEVRPYQWSQKTNQSPAIPDWSKKRGRRKYISLYRSISRLSLPIVYILLYRKVEENLKPNFLVTVGHYFLAKCNENKTEDYSLLYVTLKL